MTGGDYKGWLGPCAPHMLHTCPCVKRAPGKQSTKTVYAMRTCACVVRQGVQAAAVQADDQLEVGHRGGPALEARAEQQWREERGREGREGGRRGG